MLLAEGRIAHTVANLGRQYFFFRKDVDFCLQRLSEWVTRASHKIQVQGQESTTQKPTIHS